MLLAYILFASIAVMNAFCIVFLVMRLRRKDKEFQALMKERDKEKQKYFKKHKEVQFLLKNLRQAQMAVISQSGGDYSRIVERYRKSLN